MTFLSLADLPPSNMTALLKRSSQLFRGVLSEFLSLLELSRGLRVRFLVCFSLPLFSFAAAFGIREKKTASPHAASGKQKKPSAR